MQIGKNIRKIVKIQETRIKIQEVSEDIQMGGIMFPKYRGKLFEDEDLKTTENQKISPGRETKCV